MNIAVNMLTFNGEHLIKRCLEAVIPYCDEVRVIDTGSTDGTVDILESLAKFYPHFHYEVHDVQHLGVTWVDNAKNVALLDLLNLVREQTKSDWILRVDDDEVFPPETMLEIVKLQPTTHAYAVREYHFEENCMIDFAKHKNMRVARLFKNTPEITWVGPYGNDMIAFNGKRISSMKVPLLKGPFLHLGEYRTGSWKHEYRYHEKGHCGVPIPEEYKKYVN